MGYSYGQTASGRWALSCDGCGKVGGVRKRTCPHKVVYAEGYSLPYCPPPALCNACYTKHKATLHKDCAAGAATCNARETARAAALTSGALEVRTAWGDWHETVPKGFVGVRFVGTGGTTTFRLVPAGEYEPGVRRYLHDYPNAQPWADPDTRPTKAVTVEEVPAS